jgi:hypothetical protein
MRGEGRRSAANNTLPRGVVGKEDAAAKSGEPIADAVDGQNVRGLSGIEFDLLT